MEPNKNWAGEKIVKSSPLNLDLLNDTDTKEHWLQAEIDRAQIDKLSLEPKDIKKYLVNAIKDLCFERGYDIISEIYIYGGKEKWLAECVAKRIKLKSEDGFFPVYPLGYSIKYGKRTDKKA